MESTSQTTGVAARRILLLSWAHFLNDGSANFLPGVLSAVLIGLSLPVSQAGPVMAILLVGQALQPVLGILADHTGGRWLVLCGLLGSSVGGAMIGLAPNPPILYAALALIGVSNAAFHPQALAATRSLSSGTGGRALSVFLVGGEIGRGVWPFVASLVVGGFGIRALWILALPGVVTVPFLLLWAPRLRVRRSGSAVRRLLGQLRPLSVLIAYSALRGLMIVAAVTFIPILWREAGGSLEVGAAFITVMLLTGIVGNLGSSFVADRIGSRTVVSLATLASAGLLAVFTLASGAALWIVVALYGVALFATLPLTVQMGQDLLPENRSMGSGLALGFANAIGAVGVAFLKPLVEAYGASAALWAAVACGAVATVISLALPAGGMEAPGGV